MSALMFEMTRSIVSGSMLRPSRDVIEYSGSFWPAIHPSAIRSALWSVMLTRGAELP